MSNYVPDFTDKADFFNIIPESFLAKVKKNFINKDINEIASKVAHIPGVEDVSYGKEWIENFSTLMGTTKKVGYFICLVLILGVFFVVSFTVYSVIVRRRDEIEIMKMLGATPKMIQIPFLFEAGVMSVSASIVSLLISYVVLNVQSAFLNSDLSFIGFSEYFSFFNVSCNLIVRAIKPIINFFK